MVVLAENYEIFKFVIRRIIVKVMDFDLAGGIVANATRSVRSERDFGSDVIGNWNAFFRHLKSRVPAIG